MCCIVKRIISVSVAYESLQSRLNKLEEIVGKLVGSAPPPHSSVGSAPPPSTAPAPEDDDDFDLFGSEEESEELVEHRATALAKYNEKKSKSK